MSERTPPSSRSVARLAAVAAMVLAYPVGILVPPFLPWVAAFLVIAVVGGSIWGAGAGWALTVRSTLLAVGALTYPFYLGGIVIPWIAVAVHVVLICFGWFAPTTLRNRLVLPQALAAGLACAIAASATQYFFPTAWRLVALVALALFFLLICATAPTPFDAHVPSPTVCALVLALSEGLVVLHALPTHWMIDGVTLSLAIATALATRFLPRVTFMGLLSLILVVGSVL